MLASIFLVASLFGTSTIAQTIAPSYNVSVYSYKNVDQTYGGLYLGNAGDGEIARLYEFFQLPNYTAGTVITSATFNFYYDGPYLNAAGPHDLYITSNTWNGSTITWANQPGPVGGVITSFNLTAIGLVTVDLTSSVNAAYQSGGPFSFLVKSPIEGSTKNDWRYVSGESLIVTIAAVPEPETYLMLLLGIGLVGIAIRRRTA